MAQWEWLGRGWLLFGPAEPLPEDRLTQLRTRAAMCSLLALLIGVIVCLVRSGQAVATLWAFASSATMVALGFLFEIPKTFRQGVTSRHGATPPGGSAVTPLDEGRLPQHFININVGDVSDCLTNIIVRVILVQWQFVYAAIDRRVVTLAAGIEVKVSEASSSPEAALATAYAIMVYFDGAVFLCGYNHTRPFPAEVYRLADVASTQHRLAEPRAQIEGLTAQERLLEHRLRAIDSVELGK